MVWRRSLLNGWSSVGQNPASRSVTSGISVSSSSSSSSLFVVSSVFPGIHWIAVSSFISVQALETSLVLADVAFSPPSVIAVAALVVTLLFAIAVVVELAAFSLFEDEEWRDDDLLTKRPLIRNRRSARFFRQLYLIFLFHTRLFLFFWNLAIIAALSAGV